MDSTHETIEIVLRHEYGRLVAALLREFGGHRLALVEDGLSQALLEATSGWRARGVPANARAWLHRAARHRIIDELRRTRRDGPLEEAADPEFPAETAAGLSDDVHDDELRALLACTEPSIPLPSQVVFALRTLCGFSTKEIANRLVTTEENVQKRWERARQAMSRIDLNQEPPPEELPGRAEVVLRMIYVIFTEGYFATSGPTVLRLELCQEALRLAYLVAAHPRYTSPAAWALITLMHLHHARRDARTDADGFPVLLEAQDRSRYHRQELSLALESMARAGKDQLNSKYHLEASIAAEHAFAPSFEDTRWLNIAQLYERLALVDPSPLHSLHAAIARSYAESPAVGLERLETMRPPTWLASSHLWLATYADFHRRLGQPDQAQAYYEKAIALAPPWDRALLERRLQQMLDSDQAQAPKG